MRRFEYHDEKSHKFWEIDVDGATYTVRYGRIDTDGQSNTKVFTTPDEAARKAQSVVKSKVKKGYVECEVQQEPVSATSLIEERLWVDPSDKEAWAVWADELSAADDPRGEWLALLSKPGCEEASAALFKEHTSAWLGPFQKGKEAAQITTLLWRNGYWDSAKVATSYEYEEVDAINTLGQLLRHESGRFLRVLKIGMTDTDGQVDFGPAVDTLVKHGIRPSLRTLHIGDFSYPDDTEISWTEHANVERLGPLYPRLETLILTGGDIQLGGLVCPTLKRLKLETGGLPKAAAVWVGNANLPLLEELEIWFGTDDYGGTCGAGEAAGILANAAGFPALKRLRMKNADFQNDICGLLGEAALTQQLNELDLTMGTMTDVGGAALLAARSQLDHLHKIDVSDNFLSDGMVAQLRAAFADKLVSTSQKEDEEDGDWLYTSVAE